MPGSEYRISTFQALLGIVGALFTAFVIWYFSFLHGTIDRLEKTISAHHGPQWEEIDKIVKIGELRQQVAKLENTIKLLETRLSLEIGDLRVRDEVSIRWIKQNDEEIIKRFHQDVDGIAQLTNKIDDDKLEATLNLAHPKSANFQINSNVNVTNLVSGKHEQIKVKITSHYNSLDDSNVILQLSPLAARRIGLSQTRGIIKVRVINPKDEITWKTIEELEEQFLITAAN